MERKRGKRELYIFVIDLARRIQWKEREERENYISFFFFK